MVTRADIVAEARSWAGTPFHHQAERKGLGVDCAGLLRGVGIALGVFPPDYRTRPEMTPFLRYGRVPDGFTMQRACDTLMTRINVQTLQPGDAILVRWGHEPQHVGIVADYLHGGLSFVHAMCDRGVIEQRLDAHMMRRIVAAYRMPGVEA